MNNQSRKNDGPASSVRLQVFLSRSGFCSRRKAMDLIFQGRVSVDGREVREPSCPVHPGREDVRVGGEKISWARQEYVLLNKPRGVVTTKADPFASRTVFDLLPAELGGLHPVGRLDKDTEGLLLLTSDGDMTYRLTHPKHHVAKTYLVAIDGLLGAQDQKRLSAGIFLDGRKTAPAGVAGLKAAGGGCAFRLTIHEGRKRQVRLMLERLGHKVLNLKRLSLGPLHLGTLKPGDWRRLSAAEIKALKTLG